MRQIGLRPKCADYALMCPLVPIEDGALRAADGRGGWRRTAARDGEPPASSGATPRYHCEDVHNLDTAALAGMPSLRGYRRSV